MKLSKDYIHYYEKILDKNYSDYHHQRRLHKVLENINQGRMKKLRILDIGCGVGEIISRLAGKVYACDISLSALKLARTKTSCIFCRADAQSLPFKDNAFGLAILADIIEHVPNPELLMLELHRVLGNRGKAILVIPNGRSFTQLYDRLVQKLTSRAFHHLHFFSLHRLTVLIRYYGFKLIKCENLTIFPSTPKILRLLINSFGTESLRRVDKVLKRFPRLGDEWSLIIKKRA